MDDAGPLFEIPANVAPLVRRDATRAAKAIHTWRGYMVGYADRSRELADRMGVPPHPDSPDAIAKRNAVLGQIDAERRSVIELLDGAYRTLGSRVPSNRSHLEPPVDLMTIDGRDFTDPDQLQAWRQVMADRIRLETSNVVAAVERLAGTLDTIADPVVLLAAERLHQMASALNPSPRRTA